METTMTKTEERRIIGLNDILRNAGVQYFTADEVVKPEKKRGNVRNGVPPWELLPNIVPTLRILDRVREELGSPLMVSSGYRSPEYNDAVGGASRSLHMAFSAIDCYSEDVANVELYEVLRSVVGDHFLAAFCGLGYYEHAQFCHFDTRGLTQDMDGASWSG